MVICKYVVAYLRLSRTIEEITTENMVKTTIENALDEGKFIYRKMMTDVPEGYIYDNIIIYDDVEKTDEEIFQKYVLKHFPEAELRFCERVMMQD